jgi:hypothetical protein
LTGCARDMMWLSVWSLLPAGGRQLSRFTLGRKACMPLKISDEPNDWRTDYSISEVIDRIKNAGLPAPLIEIVQGHVPRSLQYRCEPPEPGGVWPLQEDYIPIWTTNGTSAVGYIPSTKTFHSQHIEDINSNEPEVLRDYRHLSAWLLRNLIDAGRADEADGVAAFLQFEELDRLKHVGSLEEFLSE